MCIRDRGNLGDIDFPDVFDSSACDLGPRSCGPPTVGYIGDGEGAQINLIISGEGGEIMGVDIVSSGYNFSQGNSYLSVYDDCGIGQGGVLRPVFGPVVQNPNGSGTIPGADSSVIINPNLNTGDDPTGGSTPGSGTGSGDDPTGGSTGGSIPGSDIGLSLIHI